MHLESYYKRGRDGGTREYQVARIYLGHGRRASLHVPTGMTMEQFMQTDPERCTDFLKLEKKAGKKRKRIAPEIGARVYGPIFCDELKSIFKLAGYSVYGSAIKRNKRTYFTPDAAAVRYELLDNDAKALVGGPKEFFEMELRALRSMKSANARRQGRGITFESAFAEVLAAKCQRSQTASIPSGTPPNLHAPASP